MSRTQSLAIPQPSTPRACCQAEQRPSSATISVLVTLVARRAKDVWCEDEHVFVLASAVLPLPRLPPHLQDASNVSGRTCDDVHHRSHHVADTPKAFAKLHDTDDRQYRTKPTNENSSPSKILSQNGNGEKERRGAEGRKDTTNMQSRANERER